MKRVRRSSRGKRALVVIENVSFAHDHRARKQVDALVTDGYRVAVVCRRDPDNRAHRARANVRLYEYTGPAEATSKLGFFWEYGASLVAAFFLCVRAAIEHGFDVIQVGNPPDAHFLLALPFRVARTAVVVDQRDLSPEVYTERYGTDQGALFRVLCFLERWSWRTADHIITVNSSLKRTVEKRGGRSAATVTVVGNGPYRNRVASARDELRRDKQFLVMWLGLMGPQDHADLALLAARHVVQTFGRKDCQFVFAGDGEELEGLRV